MSPVPVADGNLILKSQAGGMVIDHINKLKTFNIILKLMNFVFMLIKLIIGCEMLKDTAVFTGVQHVVMSDCINSNCGKGWRKSDRKHLNISDKTHSTAAVTAHHTRTNTHRVHIPEDVQ